MNPNLFLPPSEDDDEPFVFPPASPETQAFFGSWLPAPPAPGAQPLLSFPIYEDPATIQALNAGFKVAKGLVDPPASTAPLAAPTDLLYPIPLDLPGARVDIVEEQGEALIQFKARPSSLLPALAKLFAAAVGIGVTIGLAASAGEGASKPKKSGKKKNRRK
jgi:hypothetical protein